MPDFSIINVLGENINVKDSQARILISELETNFDTKINSLKKQVSLGDKPRILTVGVNSGRFSTINSAIDYAKTYCTVSNRVCIVITEGTYEENITLNPNPGIDFVGIGKVTIQSDAEYPNAPLYTVGLGYFENIRFIGSNSYAVHIEAQTTGNNNYTAGEMFFRNCYFLNSDNSHASFGAGLGNGILLRLENCIINNHLNQTGLYVHNYPATDAGNMELIVKNCFFTGSGKEYITIDDASKMNGFSGTSYLFCSFQNNTVPITDKSLNVRVDPSAKSYAWFNSDNLILRNCSGNNLTGLNSKQITDNFVGTIQRVGSYYLNCQIFVPNEFISKYSFKINSVTVQGIGTTNYDSLTVANNAVSIHLTNPALNSINYGEALINATLTPRNN